MKDLLILLELPLITVILAILIVFLYRIIIKRQYRDFKYKKIDISNAKMDFIKSSLSKYDGYSKIIIKKNVFTYITEYYIYVGLVIDELGTILGKSTDRYLTVKSGKDSKEIENEIPLFKEDIKLIENIIGKKIDNKYIITGDACMFLVELSEMKSLKFKDIYYTFIKKDQDRVYTKEQIDSLASEIEKSLM